MRKTNPYHWSSSSVDLLPGVLSIEYYNASTSEGHMTGLQSSVDFNFPVPRGVNSTANSIGSSMFHCTVFYLER